MTVQVCVIDDHPIVIEGLKMVLEKFPSIGKVEGCFNTRQLKTLLENQKFDVLLLDISLGEENALDILPMVKSRYPELKIIVLTNHDEAYLVRELIDKGIDGYLLKTDDIEEIVFAIMAVYKGKNYFTPNVHNLLIPSQSSLFGNLTKREYEILGLIYEGLKTREIAEKLHVSKLTIESHRRNLFQKLEVPNATSLIKKALELKLI